MVPAQRWQRHSATDARSSRVLGFFSRIGYLRHMSAIAPRSAMSCRANAMAPAQRQAQKGNFVRIFMAPNIYHPYFYLGKRAGRIFESYCSYLEGLNSLFLWG